ncbi:POTRA domain-containing protein [Sunxiuqinia rutila]|uniref:POTRA domain-containing protein n=1 Tax=Sunxiuqinia rutila TaxID=1397841 RepID=UPI003D36D1A3
MKTTQTQAILLLLLLSCMSAFAQQSQQEQLVIDSIRISKNWRTKDYIILQELNLKTGTPTTQSAIDTAMIKIWNIGNFSSISYQIDTLPDEQNLLNITAKDALTVVPYLSFNGNKNNFQFSAGVNDNNFLGRNVGLELRGTTGSNSKLITIRTAIPRQLLYRNMALTGSFTYGNGMNYQYAEGQKVQGVGYLKKEVSLAISNPWHQDFNYKFSPDLSLQLTRHRTDSSLISPSLPQPDAYKVTYLQLGVSESMGYIKRRRHQQDGYNLGLGLTWGMGLTTNSPNYHSLSAAASWHHLFNSLVQLSASFSTAYTSSNIPSLLFYRNDVKGTYAGEVSGKAYYAAALGTELTYFNRQWLSLVQSFYFNMGNGASSYFSLYTTQPQYSAYTNLKFTIPAIPWLSISFDLVWSQRKDNWFILNL